VDSRLEAFCTIWGSDLAPDHKTQVVNSILADEQRALRHAGARAAGTMGDDTTVEILWRLIEVEDDPDIRADALTSLGELLGPSLLPRLVALIKGTDEALQMPALNILGGMEGIEVIDLLRETLITHPRPYMRFGAALLVTVPKAVTPHGGRRKPAQRWCQPNEPTSYGSR
jgi:HEAT repeat protein